MNAQQRQKWLLERKSGIGSSDGPSLMRLAIPEMMDVGFSTPEEIYADKISPGLDIKTPSERMMLGLELEPYICQRYEQKTGFHVTHTPSTIIRRDRHEWQLASPDGFCPRLDKVIECKAVFAPPSGEWGPEGTDHIPESYLIQVQHQMGVMGYKDCDVAALFVPYGFRIYPIRFDEQLFEMITEIEYDFWKKVIARSGIENWNHPLQEKVLESATKLQRGKSLRLGEEYLPIASQYQELKRIEKEAKEQSGEIKQQFIQVMGDAELAYLPDGTRLKRNLISKEGYEVKPHSYVDFRMLNPKKGES